MVGCLLVVLLVQVILVGNLIFFLFVEVDFVSKWVVNNNKSVWLYCIVVSVIDCLGGSEVCFWLVDGELLFVFCQLVLQVGESEYFKFYYYGLWDNCECYYWVLFCEIFICNLMRCSLIGGEVSMELVVVMDIILVVCLCEVQFKWFFDKVVGMVSNIGNIWFKLLIKFGCDLIEEEGDVWYLCFGDVVCQLVLCQLGNYYLVYNDKFIKISDICLLKFCFVE